MKGAARMAAIYRGDEEEEEEEGPREVVQLLQ